ncbi:MAG: pilus assembly protein PilP [Pseudomonadota bacterium]
MSRFSTLRLFALSLLSVGLLTGCGGDMSDLEKWVADKKAERVPFRNDMPEVKPREVHTYSAAEERSPFQPTRNQTATEDSGIDGPDPNRNREHLEKFSLDSMRMVGSLNTGEFNSALVQTNDGLIHRVRPGNYIGENYGVVISIDNSTINLIEKVPNGLGGWAEREAAIALSD